jgi:O-antigen ligase
MRWRQLAVDHQKPPEIIDELQRTMSTLTQKPMARNGVIGRYFVLGVLLIAGFAIALSAEYLHRIEVHGFDLISTWSIAKLAVLGIGGIAVTYLLTKYAEVSLALLFLVGLFKGDDRLASTPVDLTVLVGGAVILAVAGRLIFGKQSLRLPKEYLWYVPLLVMMVVSLFYAPDRAGGLDKTLRFIFLTGIGIVSPFVIFDSGARVRRFMWALVAGGIALAVLSLPMLGGQDRFVSPSGLNTELGAACAVAIVIIWSMVFPEWPMFKRILVYPILGVLAIGLIGSGGRFANVAAGTCVLIATWFCRKLGRDLVLIFIAGMLALPFVWIPDASIEYLSSLAHPPQAMGTRSGLMELGVKIATEHPFLGVGIEGYRFHSPNPITYNFPHNIALELASEMGFVAAFAFIGLMVMSFIAVIKLLRDPETAGSPLVHTAFLLLIFEFLDSMVSGDINDLRFMWFVIGLPFVLRELPVEELSRRLDWVRPPNPSQAPVAAGYGNRNFSPQT